jgi:two-component system NtrC family sensor kinase
MRIVLRVWLAMMATVVLVFGIGLTFRVDREQQLLLEAKLRNRRVFAAALEAGLQGASEPAQALANAQRILDHHDVANSHVSARLVSIRPSSTLPLPRLPLQQLGSLHDGENVVEAVDDSILLYVPVDAAGDVVLELVEPEQNRELLTRLAWLALVAQTLVLSAIAGAATLLVLRWFVGQPLTRLAALAERIGTGELSARADATDANDEVARLAREMNRMGERLLESRQRVEDLEADRAVVLEQLRHSDRLRTAGQLASTLAHELGTPLNVVAGHARILEQDDSLPVEARASARVVLEQGARMTRIIRDVLGFVRRKSSHRRPHDITELAREALRLLAPIARRSRVALEVDSLSAPCEAAVDDQQTLQVLTNLVTNAIEASPEGSVVNVEVSRVEATPPVGVVGTAGSHVRVRVIDRGLGVDPADMPRMFEPFFSRRPNDEGTGLGLAIVSGIVHEHRGWIAVVSAPGSGSTFEVYLPTTRPSTSAPASSTETATSGPTLATAVA